MNAEIPQATPISQAAPTTEKRLRCPSRSE
jgi:hypothetical protein